MLGKAKQNLSRKLLVASSFAMLLILMLAGIGLAAYRIGRPIMAGGGIIDQWYL